jgi:putative glutamine transport system substrate-binding protein
MKATHWMAALVVLALVLGACQPQTGGGTSSGGLPLAAAGTGLRAIQDRGKIIIGVKNDVRIFGYLNPQTNAVEGFDVDMGKAIAQYIFGDETKVEFKEAVSKNRIPFLEDGTVDVIISTMTINAERVGQVDFSDPYYVAGQSLLVPKGSPIRSIADLKGKKVGTVSGSTSEKNIHEKAPEAEVLLFDKYADAVAAMAAGQCDAVTTDDIILYGFVRDAPDKWEVVGGQFTVEPYGIAVKKGNTELRDAINTLVRAMKQDGRWAAIYLKWIGTAAPSVPPENWQDVKLP